MWEDIKCGGQIVLWIGVCLLILLYFGLFVKGEVWLTSNVLPLFEVLSAFTLLIFLIVLLPLSFFGRTRVFAGSGMIIACYIFALALWVWAFLLAYVYLHAPSTVIGWFIVGVGAVPISILGALFKSDWFTLVGLVFLTILVFGARFLGVWLLNKAA